jgi:hypothetical protein
MTVKLAVTAGLAALVLAGCADPYARHQTQPGKPASAVRPPQAPAARTSAATTARAFANLWINWDWRSAAAQQRHLALTAGGTLADQLRANADSARVDASLARDRPGSRGAIAAIDLTSRGTQAAGIVVTREQSYTDGRADLGGAHYRVYRARLAAADNKWKVTTWAPQP